MGDWPNFVRQQASLLGTPKQESINCCTPIINGKASFSRTLKRHLWRGQAYSLDRLKSEPMVRVRERQANWDHSWSVGRGRIDSAMLS